MTTDSAPLAHPIDALDLIHSALRTEAGGQHRPIADKVPWMKE